MPVLLILGGISLVIVGMTMAEQSRQPADEPVDPWEEFLAFHPELV